MAKAQANTAPNPQPEPAPVAAPVPEQVAPQPVAAPAPQQAAPQPAPVNMQDLADAQVLALQMTQDARKGYYKQNPQEQAKHHGMSENLNGYVNQHKNPLYRAKEYATEGKLGYVTLPVIGMGIAGGLIYIGEKIVTAILSDSDS
jgi:hypothetical protein